MVNIGKRQPTWGERVALGKYISVIFLSDMPAIAIGAAFSRGSDMTEGILKAAAEGRDGMAINDSVVSFPNELASEYGGPEERFGYVEMGNMAFGYDDGLVNVPFAEALKMFEILGKHYLAYRPDRTKEVNELLAQARITFARMQRDHERWKGQNTP
ncbi:hypothetical protein JJJ17_14605 [Paracoccus caeni]|uniref:Uncharacterized protein n=1 Tax=Paracoccus caeni TaxID=657651 RepID=A0A934SE25_9RHOB|nr:hypothetical protein [Paracoccus caeni]MBK4217160.1 hypothetical protein [Paracoccus caeni]